MRVLTDARISSAADTEAHDAPFLSFLRRRRFRNKLLPVLKSAFSLVSCAHVKPTEAIIRRILVHSVVKVPTNAVTGEVPGGSISGAFLRSESAFGPSGLAGDGFRSNIHLGHRRRSVLCPRTVGRRLASCSRKSNNVHRSPNQNSSL